MAETTTRPRCRPQLDTLEDRLAPTADMVLQWNEHLRDAIRTAGTSANMGSRIMAITQAAVYDSVNALDRTHEVFRVDALAHPRASREAAVAAAAHRALTAFYPAQAAGPAGLDAKLTASLATIPDGKDLGADVDLVGPGAAYERWKKTLEYQQWLKDTGQVKK